jgi:hypothetical protein
MESRLPLKIGTIAVVVGALLLGGIVYLRRAASPERPANVRRTAARPPAVPGKVAAVTHSTGASPEALGRDRTTGLGQDKLGQMVRTATVTEPTQEGKLAYWKKEDEVLTRMEDYEKVRDRMRAKAEELVQRNSLRWADTDQIVALAQEELDRFWQAGSLVSPQAYESGYLARAVMEIAAEKDPDNFRLLDALKETINSTTPYFLADYTRNPKAYEALWPIVDRQRQLVLSGKHPVDIMAYDAMVDWAWLALGKRGPKETTVAWEWLVENAEKGGWTSNMKLLRGGVNLSRQGIKFGFNQFIDRMGDDPMDNIVRYAHGRRLPSLKGSKYRRSHVVRASSVRARTEIVVK